MRYAVGNSEKEFEANIEKQLNATFGKLLKAPSQAEKTLESKPKPELPVKLYGRGISKTHTYEVYGKSGSIEFQLTTRLLLNPMTLSGSMLMNTEGSWKENTGLSEKNFREAKRIGEAETRSEIEWGRITVKVKTQRRKCSKRPSDSEALSSGTGSNKAKTGANGNGCLTMPTIPSWISQRYWTFLRRPVALDGGLGLAFGSRGHGAASAHYEVANRVINLTKTKGYSSLAHEWFHAAPITI